MRLNHGEECAQDDGRAKSRRRMHQGFGLIRRWLLSVGIILFLFLAEGVTLRSMGYRYTHHEAVAHYWVPKEYLSVDCSGDRIVARTLSRMQHKKHGLEDSTIRIDLDSAHAVESHFADLPIESIAISPTGNWVAVSQWDGSIRVSSYEHQTPFHAFQVDPHESIVSLLFSPDERVLAALGEGHVYLWNWATKQLLWKRVRNSKQPRPFAFSADSKLVLFPSDTDQLVSSAIWRSNLSESEIHCSQTCLDAIWSEREQDWLIVLQHAEGLLVRSANGDTTNLNFTEAQTGSAASVALAPERIAYMNRLGQVAIHSLHSGESICSIQQRATIPYGLAFAGEESLLRWDSEGNICRFNALTGSQDRRMNLLTSTKMLAK